MPFKKGKRGATFSKERYLALLARYGGEASLAVFLKSMVNRLRQWRTDYPERVTAYQAFARAQGFGDPVTKDLRSIVFAPISDRVFCGGSSVVPLVGCAVSDAKFDRLTYAYDQPSHWLQVNSDGSPAWQPPAGYAAEYRAVLAGSGWTTSAADADEDDLISISSSDTDGSFPSISSVEMSGKATRGKRG